MINQKDIIVFDLETTSKFPLTTEICQLAACCVDARSLEIKDSFNTYMQPLEWDKIEQEALDVNRLTREFLKEQIMPQVAWLNFVNWVQKFNKGKQKTDTYRAPIMCGYNVRGFDKIIVDRYAEKYGPYDEKRQCNKLFNGMVIFDILDHMWFWLESMSDPEDLKLTSVMRYLGFAEEAIANAHGAVSDVEATAQIAIRLLKLQRRLTQPTKDGHVSLKMKGSFLQ